MMISLGEIDFMTVLVAAITKFILGGLWYSPLLAGCAWMREMKFEGKDIDATKDRISLKMLGSFVCAYITAVIMSILIKVMHADNLVSGINLGLMVAVGCLDLNFEQLFF